MSLDYIMDLFVKYLLLEDYSIEKVQKRKNILIANRGALFLMERRFEVFMNIILFKQIIQDNIVGNIYEEMILCLIRAGMVLTNANVWKTFAIARDSSNYIDNTMKSTRKTNLAKGNKEAWTKSKKKTSKENKESGKWKNLVKAKSKRIDMEVDKEGFKFSDYTRNTEGTNEKKQDFSGIIVISSDSVTNSANTVDSQETVSEGKTDTDMLENTGCVNTTKQIPVLQQKATSAMSESMTGKGKRRIIRTSSDSEDFSSPAILKRQSQSKVEKSKILSKEIHHSELSFNNTMDLKIQEENQPVFKSIRDTKKLEKTLTKSSLVFSDFTSCAETSDSTEAQKRISAYNVEYYYTNTHTNISTSMLGTMGAEENTNTRSLRPREHMDKISKYISII